MNSLNPSLAILVATTSFAQQAEPPRLSDTQIRVANIPIGSAQKDVLKRFGKVIQKTITPDPMFCDVEMEIKFKGVRSYFCGGNLVNLVCSTPKYATPDGIRVGMPFSLVIARFGNPETQLKDNATIMIYRSQTSDTALVFHIKKGVIQSIELWSDFT